MNDTVLPTSHYHHYSYHTLATYLIWSFMADPLWDHTGDAFKGCTGDHQPDETYAPLPAP